MFHGDTLNPEMLEKQIEEVKKVKEETRVIVILGYSKEIIRAFLVSAYDQGMMNGEYIFVAIDIVVLLGVTDSYRPELDMLQFTLVL